MKVLLLTDLEGCAGIFHREMQITAAAAHEYARTLRICTAEVNAAIRGAWSAGAEQIWVQAAHDIDAEMLPPGVQLVRGVPSWDTWCFEQEQFDALVMVGLHGGAHLTDCALGHSFLPSWQIELANPAAEGWAKQVAPQMAGAGRGEFSTVEKFWINDRMVGETSTHVAMAAGYGVPTACVCGCIHACQEAAECVPEVEQVPVKWGVHFRAARMLSPAGAQAAIEAGVERALRRLPGMPLWQPARGPLRLAMRYVHPERADRASGFPGACQTDEHTVEVTVPDGRAIPEARFLFARPRAADDPATAEEAWYAR